MLIKLTDLVISPAQRLGGLVVPAQVLPLLVEDVPVHDLLHPDDPVVQLPGVGSAVIVLVQAVNDLPHFLIFAKTWKMLKKVINRAKTQTAECPKSSQVVNQTMVANSRPTLYAIT